MFKNKEDGYTRCNFLDYNRCNGQSAAKVQYFLTLLKHLLKFDVNHIKCFYKGVI